MNPITFADLSSAVDELNTRFPRPEMDHLKISDLCDVKDASASWPNPANPGVYAMLNEHRELIYLGKASCNTSLGMRLGAHFYKTGAPKNAKFEGIRYVVTIPVPDDRAFEAPAVEEFLIGRLNPSLCLVGRKEPVRVSDG